MLIIQHGAWRLREQNRHYITNNISLDIFILYVP
uniref:Uncharacterized protein n=1 Tax=Myoviridae sp. ctkfK18 TaxID=2825165 RepID=A0A8S5VH07_9CAUD|nr:MAG TPA: hypothetical protein [Myoviridae sp. ctkfK18]